MVSNNSFTSRHLSAKKEKPVIAQEEMLKKDRVCIIGCGPSGMSALYHFSNLPDEEMPEIICYEKQSTWGGQWNPTWKIGTDEYGELVHSTLYPQLLTNVPKEVMEYPDYSFQQHFGTALPSYVDAPTTRKYLEGRMKNDGKNDLHRCIKFSTVVRKVEYNENKQTFTVTVHNLQANHTYEETGFNYIIVATGIFSVPFLPIINGAERFKGRILHSRDFREASEFAGKNILILGPGYSGQDLAQITLKYGAKRVIISWLKSPTGYKWAPGIEERPEVKSLNENSAHFSDGSSANIDTVIFCTGYQKHYPFLPDDLRLYGELSFYPDNLYKGILWMKGGNGRVLYLGTQDQTFTFSMFDVQALWACKYITGKLETPDKAAMLHDISGWRKRHELIKDAHGAVDFQTEYIADLGNEVGYINKFKETSSLLHRCIQSRSEDINTFRDLQFKSVYSGVLATPPQKP